ncbi:MAG: peptidase M6 [Pseudomonadota bacterium]
MATHSNKTVSRIFTTYHSQNNWAYLSGIGWKKVKTGNADGSTNCHIALTAGRANGKVVTVITDGADSLIEQVYL